MPTLFRRFKWRTSNSCRSCVTPQTWLIRHQSVVHEREGQGPWTFLLDVVGIFPNEDAIVRIFGLLMLEQNDVYGPLPVCKGNSNVAADTVLAVVYPASVREPFGRRP